MIRHEQFRDFITGLGFEPPRIIEPGRIARFSTNGKRGDDAGWAKLFPDGECGVVGDWRADQIWTWHAQRNRPLTDGERKALRKRIERQKHEANWSLIGP